jgi:hypothetical protein
MTKKPTQQDLGIKVEATGSAKPGPVECLGMTFANDDERRRHFLELLRQKLKEPEFRKIEGFPIGTDEAILALSDPPYYTACPNPWLGDLVRQWQADKQKLQVQGLQVSGSADAGFQVTGSKVAGSRDTESQPSTCQPATCNLQPAPLATCNLEPPNLEPGAAAAAAGYHREPFAVDVSEGKTHPIYKAHPYHTKVPHLAIVPSVLHYTEPGDIVLDGFCGSGMTGVAAQWCGTAPEAYRRELEGRWQKEGLGKPRWGTRRAILNDLSPAATFIAANYTIPFDVDEFAAAARKLLDEVEDEIGWMYETLHTDGKTKGRIEYTVWSEVYSCPHCAGEVVFTEEALDEESQQVKDGIPCPICQASLSRKVLERLYVSRSDTATGETVRQSKRKPVIVVYSVGEQRHGKKPDGNDLALLARVGELPLPDGFPTCRMMLSEPRTERWGDEWRAGTANFTHVHNVFLPRAAQALAALWCRAVTGSPERVRHMLLYFVEQAVWGLSVMNRYGPLHFSQVNRYMAGHIRIMSQHSECSPWYILEGKLGRLRGAFREPPPPDSVAAVTTGTAERIPVPDGMVDYVFTDPPFGDNLAYSELNFIVEAFHGVFTRQGPEAIVSQFQGKALPDYQRLMQRCFEEYYRVLKPGRWMTVVFHNSRNAVWSAIQEALQVAGFVVADVRTMDKQQGSFNQVTTTAALKQDLIISAYKPNGGLEKRFRLIAGTEEGVWDFLRTHLRHLPVCVVTGGKVETLAERKAFQLYDRMVAFHVQRGVTVPMSSPEFHVALAGKLPERDDMYFLPEQVAEYDRGRMRVQEMGQLPLIPRDEETTIRWVREELRQKPRSFSDLQPDLMRKVSWQRHEKTIELCEMLDQNFLCYDGNGDVPSQIHGYLSTNWPELRKLAKDSDALRAKAKGRWYVPDPNKAGDLEKIREKALLREFWEYLPDGYAPAKPGSQDDLLPGFKAQAKIPKGKRLAVIRLEAVRAGFKYCWQNRDYQTIIAVARRIPEDVLQEDPKLLMWYDQAMTRMGEG